MYIMPVTFRESKLITSIQFQNTSKWESSFEIFDFKKENYGTARHIHFNSKTENHHQFFLFKINHISKEEWGTGWGWKEKAKSFKL